MQNDQSVRCPVAAVLITMTQLEQFLGMLDNLERTFPRVHRSRNINLTQDSLYHIVEMTSSTGRMIWGFGKETGELRDILGPVLLPRLEHQPFCEELSELIASAFQASVAGGV